MCREMKANDLFINVIPSVRSRPLLNVIVVKLLAYIFF